MLNNYSILLGLILLSITACKDDFIDPIPQNNCSTCTCLEFDSTAIIETTASNNYSAIFYFQASTSMMLKYTDYSMLMNGSGTADVITATGVWANENTNFSGEILHFSDVDILFDFSSYPQASKTIAFDVNGNLGDYTFKINGFNYTALPSGLSLITTSLSEGYHVEVSGNINTIELGGWELAIDNMCLEDYTPSSNPAICQEFEDTTFNTSILTSQTSYGSPFYTFSSGTITFKAKYVDYEALSFLNGSVFWGAPNAYGTDENINFVAQLLQINNCDVEIDFSALSYTNKRVSFDVSNIQSLNNTNEFMVNGVASGTLPSGVTYSNISLGNANNGAPCFRVQIEGPINTIVLKGWETTYDNICVESI